MSRLLQEPLASDASTEALLREIQGGILEPNRRRHASFVFVELESERSSSGFRRWLREQLRHAVTSAWHERRDEARESRFFSIHLSDSGYRKLRLEAPDSDAFREGMARRRRLLSDPSPSRWDVPFRADRLDVLVNLADNDRVRLAKSTVEVSRQLSQLGGQVSSPEFGSQLRRDGRDIEHFGFVDGVSQPRFFSGGESRVWSDLASPDLVLFEHPARSGVYGSFLVLRKLEQNVAGWAAMVRDAAESLGIGEDETSARIMGRWADGRSLTHPGGGERSENDFDYSLDPDGRLCPMDSHVRRMNPRRSEEEADPERRIARRAITYGLRPDLHPIGGRMFGPPENGVGLFFLCYQASLERQFEYLQMRRANRHGAGSRYAGLDPVVGQGVGRCVLAREGRGKRPSFSFEPFVRMCGGGYFHTPGRGLWRALT